ncbi:MAG: sigma-70 family RNA polymerase sigma factor [Oscillospiraceae bacterium]|nr:sigma-70 family RNA polymerase sigma factor [Oscillospiraceae bacterium]
MTETQIRSLMYHDPKKGQRALFDEYYTYVYAIAYRKICGIGTREDVEECVSDVFHEVFRQVGNISEGSLKAYIGTVAKNKAINVCRYVCARSRRAESLDEFEQEYASDQNVEQDVEQSELTDRLLSCIEELGEPDATIIVQKYYYDRKSYEIAAMIGKNPAWVRTRCKRILKRLREALADLQ